MRKSKIAAAALAAVLAAAPVMSYAAVPSYTYDDDDHDSGSSSSSSSSATENQGNSSSVITAGAGQTVADVQNNAGQQTTTPQTNAGPATADTQANANVASQAQTSQQVTVSVGGAQVESVVVGAGTVTGSTVVEAQTTTTVSTDNGGAAVVVSSAISTTGDTRTLLAEITAGATVQEVAVAAPDGTQTTRKAVVYADGTQVVQKAGADELAGFTQPVLAAEQAINSGTQTVAAAYNAQVADVDLNQYHQVGTAVVYEVKPGAAAGVVQTEKTSLPAGTQVVVLVTDANGNVYHAVQTVGANGIVQYQLPGANCIVRLLTPKA